MRLFLALSGLVSLLGIGASPQEDAAQDALKGYAAPWAGFGVGSYIRVSHTSPEAVYDKATKKLVWQDVAHDRTYTVEKIDKEQVWVKPAQFGLAELPSERCSCDVPAEMSGKGVKRGDDDVLVGGTLYKCVQYEIQSPTAIVQIWKSAELPGWAAKILIVVDDKKNPRRETTTCVSPAEKVKIDDRDISCIVYETAIEAGDQRTEIKEWRTEAVPGRVARRELRIFTGGNEQKHLRETFVVTSFEVKK